MVTEDRISLWCRSIDTLPIVLTMSNLSLFSQKGCGKGACMRQFLGWVGSLCSVLHCDSLCAAVYCELRPSSSSYEIHPRFEAYSLSLFLSRALSEVLDVKTSGSSQLLHLPLLVFLSEASAYLIFFGSSWSFLNRGLAHDGNRPNDIHFTMYLKN